MNLQALYWREPLWLILLALPVLVMALNNGWRRSCLNDFADAELIPWLAISAKEYTKRLPLYSLWLSWFCLSVALAGPRFIQQLPDKFQIENSMLIVIADLSASMNAADVRPDRRDMAQRLLTNWLSQKDPSQAVGIVLFAGHAFELLPATTDDAVISHFINSLSDIHLPTAGNDLAAALKLAEISLLSTEGHRRLLILTDGDIEQGERQLVSKILNDGWANFAIQTHIIGVGESRPVIVPDRLKGVVEFQNRPVLSRLEAGWLRVLSNNHPAIEYQHYRQLAGLMLNDIIELPSMRVSAEDQQQVIWQEMYQLPLLLGVFFLLMSFMLHNQKARTQEISPGILPVIIMLFLMANMGLIQPVALADDKDTFKQAQRLLDQGQYQQARQLFRQLSSIEAMFSEATACYRLKDYACARQAFASVAWSTHDKDIRAKAVFNLANSYFFSGDYDQAVVLYRDAQLQGIDSAIIAQNLAYAESVQASILRHLKHLQQSFNLALWKAAASGDKTPSLSDFLSSNESYISVDLFQGNAESQYKPPAELIQNALLRQLGLSPKQGQKVSGKWVETDRVQSQSSAEMINRLFEMGLGIHAPVNQPQVVEGKRKW